MLKKTGILSQKKNLKTFLAKYEILFFYAENGNYSHFKVLKFLIDMALILSLRIINY